MKKLSETAFRIRESIRAVKGYFEVLNYRRIYNVIVLLFMTLFIPSAFTLDNNVTVQNVKKTVVNKTVTIEYKYLKQLKDYRHALSLIESRNDYTSRRIIKYEKKGREKVPVYSQYWGKYQIGKKERETLGLKNVSWEVFSTHPELQDAACNLFIAITKQQLSNFPYKNKPRKNYLQLYSNRVVNNFYLTESGIIAMAHNCGVYGMVDFLEKNGRISPMDGLKTNSTNYLTLANFHIDITVADAKRELDSILDSLDIPKD